MKGKAFSLLVVTMVLSSAIILSFVGIISAQEEPDIIYIDDDGYYVEGPFDPWSFTDVWVNVTVEDGEKVDVYVMTYTQYDNAYPWEEREPRAVSFEPSSEENVSSASIHHQFNTNYNDVYEVSEEGVFIVIDNRQCNITPDDADPTGQVRVEMTTEYTEGDPFDGLGGIIWPVIGIVILEALSVVGVIIVLFMIVRYFDKKKKEEQALQPPPTYPYYPGQPFQYQQPMQPPQQVQPISQPQPSQPAQPAQTAQPVEPIAQPPSEVPAQPPSEAPAESPSEIVPKKPEK